MTASVVIRSGSYTKVSNHPDHQACSQSPSHKIPSTTPDILNVKFEWLQAWWSEWTYTKVSNHPDHQACSFSHNK